MRAVGSAILFAVMAVGPLQAQEPATRIALVKMPYSGARNVAELSGGPDYLQDGGLETSLEERGVRLKPTQTVRLRPEEEDDYGEWHRMGLANGHLAELVAANRTEGFVSVGLLSNCTSVIGVLGGLQASGPGRRPLKVGLVFIDAHGDFNTPETTLSGMLGGMPVAVSAGLALDNLRRKSGLEPALPTRYIVMGGLRDVDPLEQDLLDRSDVQTLSTDDIRDAGTAVRTQMERLSELTDVIYVHVDMDVLDPREVAGHPLTVPDGPTSEELGQAIGVMFEFEKVAALGIASTPWGERDPDGLSRQAAYNLIDGALAGLEARRKASRP
jgi:arginase